MYRWFAAEGFEYNGTDEDGRMRYLKRIDAVPPTHFFFVLHSFDEMKTAVETGDTYEMRKSYSLKNMTGLTEMMGEYGAWRNALYQ
ncbi:hypothetical protein [Leptolyngbya sp. FACHB-261]|uniref:hypothetical protein n=1 Tax=Leptolyngbya sp. FACHB-261 TaxID=2692806 RepID=UPI0016851A8A|nr:hypothetical protein [Leptolyngbya sp. FACHB-261]MBD2102132.1 hypothetical protein [Leptolyngbya sp. FACHB-261]